MANLKQDILNNLGNDRYYKELELARLAQDGNAVYKEKVDAMSALLKELGELDLATQLVERYFKEPEANQQVAPEQPAPAPAPEQPKTHPGQSHGE